MGYTMKGSPAKLGTIQGTSGHKSALKTAMDDALTEGKVPSPNKSWLSNLAGKVGLGAKKAVDKLKDKKATLSKAITEKTGKKDAPSSEATRPSKRTKRLTKRYKKVKERNVPKGHTTKRERRLEEKLHTSKKSDTMGPGERLAAKRVKREKIRKGLDTVFNYDSTRQKKSKKAKSGNVGDFVKNWVSTKGPELKVNKDLTQKPHKTKSGKWKTVAQHTKDYDKKRKATDTYKLGDYSKGKSKFGTTNKNK